MNMLIDPAVFFIDEEDWKDQGKRQIFIDQLIALFIKTKEYDFVKTAWLDEMSSAIWDNKNIKLRPWLIQPEYRNLISEPFFKFLNTVKSYDGDFPDCGALSPNVELFNDSIRNAFYQIIHSVIDRTDKSLIYPNFKQSDESKEYSFECEKHGEIKLRSFDSLNHWLKEIDFSNDYFWPVPKDNESISRFKMAIELFIDSNDSQLVYPAYGFSPEFIQSIHKKNVDRKQLLKALSMRLSCNQREASDNKSLHDEPVRKTENNIRRFRVNQKCRIHYKYDELGSITFVEYDDIHKNVM